MYKCFTICDLPAIRNLGSTVSIFEMKKYAVHQGIASVSYLTCKQNDLHVMLIAEFITDATPIGRFKDQLFTLFSIILSKEDKIILMVHSQARQDKTSPILAWTSL